MLRSAALWNLLAPSVPTVEPLPVRIDAELLPLYSVLVPLYREASVVPHLVAALTAIDYPAARLEILLVLEAIDTETQDIVRAAALPRHMRVLVVPDGDPRTKPRAIQYALQFTRGDYIVVYDAEDMPEPDQLRRALAVLMAEPGRLGCLQARLNIYNSRASWLTRGIMAQTHTDFWTWPKSAGNTVPTKTSSCPMVSGPTAQRSNAQTLRFAAS